MAKRIIEMAHAKRNTITKYASEAGQNAQLAVAAIIGGVRSPAWRSYMMQFIEQNTPGVPVEPAQLERLLATDGTMGDVVLDRRRAYLVANAVCGSETILTTTFTVDTIDDTLPNVGRLKAGPEVYPSFRKKVAPRNRRGKKKAGKKASKKASKKAR
jgi:hypothetical protein